MSQDEEEEEEIRSTSKNIGSRVRASTAGLLKAFRSLSTVKKKKSPSSFSFLLEEEGDPYCPECVRHLDKVFGLAVSKDAKTVISSSLASFIQITSIKASEKNDSLIMPDTESKKVKEIELKDSKNDRRAFIRTVALCANERYFLTGSNDGTIERWKLFDADEDGMRDAKSIEEFPHGLNSEGHTTTVTSIEVTSDDRYAVSASHDSTCIVWDLHGERNWDPKSDKSPPKAIVKHRCCAKHHKLVGKIRCLAVSKNPKEPYFVAGGDDAIVRVWSVEDGMLKRELSCHRDRITALAFDPSASHIASGSRDRRVVLWDWKQGTDILTVHADLFEENVGPLAIAHSDQISLHDYPTSLAFAPDGNYLSYGCSGSHIVTFFVAASYDFRPR